jgi:hypothetical protein
MAEDRERRDAFVDGATLRAHRGSRLEARRRGEGHAGAEATGLTCGEVSEGLENRRKIPRIMVSSSA